MVKHMPEIRDNLEYVTTTFPKANWDMTSLLGAGLTQVQGRVTDAGVLIEELKGAAQSRAEFQIRFIEVESQNEVGSIKIMASANYKIDFRSGIEDNEELANLIFDDSIEYLAAELVGEIARAVKVGGLRTPLNLDPEALINTLRGPHRVLAQNDSGVKASSEDEESPKD
ncbi:hypothetical protein [Deinococcus aestuarii]|uniref:hypothetical protein n=1 Tax=Deinococcus aestuarii TaxID=2774531 RepID=UPI001C0DB69E|nr:hypothetical protein [Deinococcus aestuarii]